jgi:hypothetical protein
MVPVDLRQPFRPDAGETFYKPARSPAMTAAMETVPFQKFLEFVQYPVWVVEPAPDLENGTRVRLVDLRFGTPVAPGFQASAIVTSLNQIVSSTFAFGIPRPR